jgi:hypothetical protein
MYLIQFKTFFYQGFHGGLILGVFGFGFGWMESKYWLNNVNATFAINNDIDV